MSFNGRPGPYPAENGARTICALLLVLTIVGMVVVPQKVGHTSGAEVGRQSVQTGDGTGPTAGGAGAAPAKPKVTPTRLRRNFPVPPGAHRTRNKNLLIGPDEQVYLVRSRLKPVERFYLAHLKALGLATATNPGVTRNGNGTVVGYDLSFYSPDNDVSLSGLIGLNENFLGTMPGVVTIEVNFD